MRKLYGRMRYYPWGSRTHLAALTGRPAPSAEPEAEIWYGAHPAEPCLLDGGSSLAAAIQRAPEAELGGRVVEQFGAELPFLLKLLAAGEPLSLQAHPSAAQAQAGFARENALGVPLDDPKRNYKDPRHKPELLVALTGFEALAGFADDERTRAFFQALDVLKLPAEGRWSLEETVAAWTRLSPTEAAPLVARLGEAAAALAGVQGEFAAHAGVVVDLARRYPQDPGVLIALLLNHVVLEPGEGLFVPAGVLHAHLSGLGVEIMANSDNVLRGGLTTKHVDVDELLDIVDFSPTPRESLVVRVGEEPKTVEYPVMAEEFSLAAARLAEGETSRSVGGSGPEIVLCVAGEAEVGAGGVLERLAPGEAVWLPPGGPGMTIAAREDGTAVFRARVPDKLLTHVSRGRP